MSLTTKETSESPIPFRDVWGYEWREILRDLEHRLFQKRISPSEVELRAPLWVCQWLLETTHDRSGIWARPPKEGIGAEVRMATGDLRFMPAPDVDEKDAEWVEVLRAGEVIERLRLRSEVT